ncbi:MAG TPA: alpha/beta hydrolase [Arenibaculum sp.]|nr:alpha/beta hydrolase [Arenibaculum sp.]
MPRVRVNGVELHYDERGSGAETLVFAHGLLCSRLMFRDQIDALSDTYRCIAFDFRGHGSSEATRTGYDMPTLLEDVAGLVAALGAGPCHYVGHSMGGFVGMALTLRYPDLVKSLVLVNTTADPETFPNVLKYRALSVLARVFGLAIALDPAMRTLFGPKFMKDPAQAERREEWKRRLMENRFPAAARAVSGVLGRGSLLDQLDRIAVPALIIAGADDIATRPSHSLRMHDRIRDSRLHVLPGVGHASTVEAPETVGPLIRRFLAAVGTRSVPSPADRHPG